MNEFNDKLLLKKIHDLVRFYLIYIKNVGWMQDRCHREYPLAVGPRQSLLKKKLVAISYHKTREVAAAGIAHPIEMGACGVDNFADVLTIKSKHSTHSSVSANFGRRLHAAWGYSIANSCIHEPVTSGRLLRRAVHDHQKFQFLVIIV
jgi:hypothetical protein